MSYQNPKGEKKNLQDSNQSKVDRNVLPPCETYIIVIHQIVLYQHELRSGILSPKV